MSKTINGIQIEVSDAKFLKTSINQSIKCFRILNRNAFSVFLKVNILGSLPNLSWKLEILNNVYDVVNLEQINNVMIPNNSYINIYGAYTNKSQIKIEGDLRFFFANQKTDVYTSSNSFTWEMKCSFGRDNLSSGFRILDSKLNVEAQKFVSSSDKSLFTAGPALVIPVIQHLWAERCMIDVHPLIEMNCVESKSRLCNSDKSNNNEQLCKLPIAKINGEYDSYLWILRNVIRYEQNYDINFMQNFDMFNVKLNIVGQHNYRSVWVSVPGITEQKPRLEINDKVHLYWLDQKLSKITLLILNVIEDRVTINYPSFDMLAKYNIPHPTSQSFHIRFESSYDNQVYFAYDRAICEASRHEALTKVLLFMLFDGFVSQRKVQSEIKDKEWIFDLNTEQKNAVNCIIQQKNYQLPHSLVLLYGPAGVGKTKTLMEAVIQILSKIPKTKILFVTPSEYAADLVAEQLAKYLNPKELFRLNSFQRHTSSPASLYNFCSVDETTGLFVIPDRKQLLNNSCIVTTCKTARLFVDLQMNNHFTHFIFDEAAQAHDAEILIPLSLVTLTSTIVLSGDIAQMAPNIHDPRSMNNGFHISLFEKLLSLKNRPTCIFLTKNYRTNDKLLTFISDTFYDNMLMACAKADETVLKWKMLPAKFPLLFCGILGTDHFDTEHFAFYNPEEINKVRDIVMSLHEQKDLNVSLNDIVVLAPYKLQVNKIRHKLREHKLGAVKVEEIDALQGSEAKIIILSTVLSRNPELAGEHISPVAKELFNRPSRFTVAISRAKSLLVIVGNPFILAKDRDWRKLINFADKNNVFQCMFKPFSLKY